MTSREGPRTFYNFINDEYGVGVLKHLKDYNHFGQKLSILVSQRIFLMRCKSNFIFPKVLFNSVNKLSNLFHNNNPYETKIENMLFSFKLKSLNMQIKICHFEKRQCERSMRYSKDRILESIDDSVIIEEFFWKSGFVPE